MSARLLTAAALMALTGLVHVTMGGAEVYHPLLDQTPDPVLNLYLALLWHFVTAYFVLGATAMAWAAMDPGARRQTAACVAILGLAMGALFLGLGVSHLGEPWTAPQWTITLTIAALALWPRRAKAMA